MNKVAKVGTLEMVDAESLYIDCFNAIAPEILTTTMAPKVDDAKHELKRKLYDALLLLKGEEDKRVQKVSTTYFIKHFSWNKKTAEELFADSNAQIRENAKEWLKHTAENCSIVAVLIATAAFSAA
ncbi:hypothetical protein RJ639_013655 [Escallonia herrerae]|uniref:Uncharacterized protein n=1 Tax=Escallonia herrerae TaxID=1293975 RepID=A0AA88VJB6_9ASTE|nr:hypothetical protein RJ639_013655 [Escallonia herrerae]